MNRREQIDSMLKDQGGNYYVLEIDDESTEFVPEEPDFPNACRYMVVSAGTIQGDENASLTLLIEDISLHEEVVKELKKIHGICDPWDDDPHYFDELKKNQPGPPPTKPGPRNTNLPRYFLWADRVGTLVEAESGKPDFQIYEEDSDSFSSHPELVENILNNHEWSHEIADILFNQYLADCRRTPKNAL